MGLIARTIVALALLASGAVAMVGSSGRDDATRATPADATTTGSTTTTEVTTSTTGAGDPADASDAGRAFAQAKRTWIGCVQDAHAAHRAAAAQRREAGEARVAFDREAACGERPNPSDVGLGTERAREARARRDDGTTSAARRSAGTPKGSKATGETRGKGHGADG